MFEYVNEIAVLVASLLALAVGNIWYSSLAFGPSWLRAQGKDPHADILPDKHVPVFLLKGTLAFICFFSIVAFLQVRLQAAGLSASLVLLMVVGIVASYMAHTATWERRPLSYFLVNVGYALVVTYGGFAVITYWPW